MTLICSLSEWNQPATQTATVTSMVVTDPDWINLAKIRQSGYRSRQAQKSQLIRDQGRRGGVTIGPGYRPVWA